jgi:predicted PurR-regulated permease PerM
MKELRFVSPLRTAAIMLVLVICFAIVSWAQDVIVTLLFATIFPTLLFPLRHGLEAWGRHILFGKLRGSAGLIPAIPVTAICKIIFDMLPGFKAVVDSCWDARRNIILKDIPTCMPSSEAGWTGRT